MLLRWHDFFDSCVIDAEKLVGSSNHVNFVWLSFGTLLVKELVYRLISWLSLKVDRHDQKNVFRNAGEPRFEMRLDFGSSLPD